VSRTPCLVLCLLLGFPHRCWLRRRTGLLCRKEASGQARTRMYRFDARVRLAGRRRWIIAFRGRCRCGAEYCWQHAGWAVEWPVQEALWPGSLALFLPPPCAEVCPFLDVYSSYSGTWMVTANQKTKDLTEGGDSREPQGDVPRSI
jgi:hypothetical protein